MIRRAPCHVFATLAQSLSRRCLVAVSLTAVALLQPPLLSQLLLLTLRCLVPNYPIFSPPKYSFCFCSRRALHYPLPGRSRPSTLPRVNASGNATRLVVARVYLYSQLKLKGSKFTKTTNSANVCQKTQWRFAGRGPQGFHRRRVGFGMNSLDAPPVDDLGGTKPANRGPKGKAPSTTATACNALDSALATAVASISSVAVTAAVAVVTIVRTAPTEPGRRSFTRRRI